jgi:hypothetical protein
MDNNRQIPVLSDSVMRIVNYLADELPLVKTCIWEPRWLHGWMNLQPPSNWVIVETEREVLESVFYRLTDIFKNVFLDPDRKVVNLYVMQHPEAIIVKPLLSGALTQLVGNIISAAPEKMLVDIVAEPNLFRAQQGEIELIFVNAFREVPIDRVKMMGYARRRRRYDAVLELIPEKYRSANPTFLPK